MWLTLYHVAVTTCPSGVQLMRACVNVSGASQRTMLVSTPAVWNTVWDIEVTSPCTSVCGAGWTLVAALLTCTLIGGALVGFADLWVIFRRPRSALFPLPNLAMRRS